MSITAKIQPAIALAGNPVLVTVKTSREENIRIRLEYADDIYEAGAVPDKTGKCIFQIEDILQTYFTSMLPVESDDLLHPIEGSVLTYTLAVSGKSNTVKLSGKCYPGGVSSRFFRQLVLQNTDIFKAKLLNPETNFFLTTRSQSNIIAMRETETGYLYFINNGHALTIQDLHGHQVMITPAADDNIYALSIKALRRIFYEQGTLPSYLQIQCINKVIATVCILPGSVSPTILMFKNSFGLFENIELSGIPNVQPNIKSQASVDKFDETTWKFISTSSRSRYNDVLNIASGYKTIEELQFIQDLLISDEVYLLSGRERIRVLVSSTKLKYKRPVGEPTSIEIKITLADQESFIPNISLYIEERLLTNKAHQPITTITGEGITVNKYQQ